MMAIGLLHGFFRSHITPIIILVIFTSVLGLWGGTPYYHPDFISEQVSDIIREGGNNFYNYPGYLIYLNLIKYKFAGVILTLFGAQDIEAQLANYDYSVQVGSFNFSFLIISHLITLTFSILGTLAVYALTYLLTRSKWLSFLASLLTVTSLIWVANSHFITVDLPLSAMAITTVAVLVYFLKVGRLLRPRFLAAVGILAGLVIATKYNGALILLPIMAAIIAERGHDDRRLLVKDFLRLIIPAGAVFILFNIHALSVPMEFARDFYHEMKHAQAGHLGYSTQNAYVYHMKNSLPIGFGLLPMLLAALGFGKIMFDKNMVKSIKLAVLVFPAATYLVIGGSALAFDRYALPLVPFLALGAVIGLGMCKKILDKRIKLSRHISFALWALFIAVFLLVPNAILAAHHNLILSRTDTRELLRDVFSSAEDVKDANIYGGRYISDALTGFQVSAEESLGYEYFIYDSFSHDRHIYDAGGRRELGVAKTAEPDRTTRVIRISPFTKDKSHVPFSPSSIYSPYLPDLFFRHSPGPFIEIYADQTGAVRLLEACAKSRVACIDLPLENGYYYQRLHED